MKKMLIALLLLIVVIVGTACSKEDAVLDDKTTAVEENNIENDTEEAANAADSSAAQGTETAQEENNHTYEEKIDSETGLPLINIGSYVVDIDEAEVDYSEYLDEIGVVAGEKYIYSHEYGETSILFFNNGDCSMTYSTKGHEDNNIVEKSNYFVKGNHVYIWEPFFSQRNLYNVYEIEEEGASIHRLYEDEDYRYVRVAS